MDPPSRPSSFRKPSSKSTYNPLPQPDFKRVASPPSLLGEPEKMAADNYTMASDISERVWTNSANSVAQRTTSLQIELAECVETKTVTTTTTTKRTYPPLLVQPPRSLQTLDPKEYPLALKPTPHELTNFSYEVDGVFVQFREDETLQSPKQNTRYARNYTPRSTNHARGLGLDQKYQTPDAAKASKGTRESESINGGWYEPEYSSRPKSPDSLGKIPTTYKTAPRIRSCDPSQRTSAAYSHSVPKATSIQTPDITELDPMSNNRSALSLMISASDTSSEQFDEATSPSIAAAHASFPSAVATPPIADNDLESFMELSELLPHTSEPLPRPTINTAGVQNASLPSPSLSPTFAAANLHNSLHSIVDDDDTEASGSTIFSQLSDSQESHDRHALDRQLQRMVRKSSETAKPTMMDSMLDTFDAMPSEMKSYMMFQLLRRCPRPTLHVVANAVNPALKCDFLGELPPELSLHILGFLGHKDLCRAAQVSRRWRNIIDENETGWKELFDKDSYVLPAGELERAIKEGWGWQDPSGADGWERDLSSRPASSDGETAIASSSVVATQALPSKPRLMKRKRLHGSLGLDRAKRRAVSQETNEKPRSAVAKGFNFTSDKISKSEGPTAAAIAAALAVPNPNLGLPTLRKLHLFKSLYRRHHMLQRNWASSKIQPHHMAFPAHPRHVITCLQFDDDKILTGSDDTFIHVYDTRSGKLRKRLEGHEGGVWALQYEGNVLVSGSTDRSVRVWDIEKGLCTQVFHGHTSTVRCLQILMPVKTGRSYEGRPVMVPEKPLIITGSRDSQLRVWRLPEQGAKRYIQTGPPANDTDCPYFIRVLAGHTHSVRAIAAHEDTLVSGSYDHSVRVWKISTGETLYNLRGHGQKVYSVVLDNQRKRCISGSMDNTVKIWSLETGACLYTLEGHSSLVGLLDLQDNRLVSAAADSTLRIWDPENGQCKSTLTAHTGAITCFQHDSLKVVSGSDRTLKMWDVKTGECLKDLLTELSGVWQVKFDERRCVAAVQRDSLTYIEVLDFGASRDGIPAEERGRRILLPPSDADRIVDDDDFQA